MKRLLLIAMMMIAVASAQPAAAAPDCFYVRVPVPDGGERVQIEVCP